MVEVVDVKDGNKRKSVLVVNQGNDGALGKWLNEMCGHSKKYLPNWVPHWGVRAFERMGSIEQLALADLEVTFDPRLHELALKASNENTASDKHSNRHGDKTLNTGKSLRDSSSDGNDAVLRDRERLTRQKEERRQRRQRERQQQQEGGDQV